MTYKTKAISYEVRERVFWTMFVASIIAFVFYFYAVNMIAVNTATRQDLENKVASLNSELSELEFEYIAKRQEINMELAYEYGFEEVKTPLYITRASGGTLTLNTR